ncbi:MAG: CynX/NimT family MFS transporter [Bacteroidota bacterium]
MRRSSLLLMVAIVAISLNLRPPIAGIGPLVQEIRLDTGLANTLLGLLTTLPLIAFGVFSIWTSSISKRIGTEITMGLALILVAGGTLLRVLPLHVALFGGTLVLGIGIALGNTLLPGIAKKHFPHRFGQITGIYAATLGLGAALASGISVPLSEGLGWGWRWALGAWGFVALIALLIWLPFMKRSKPVLRQGSLRESLHRLGRSSAAWHVSLFMGFQSFTFYVIIAWLPDILIEQGMSPLLAGWMLFLTQIVGVTATLFIPAWAAGRRDQVVPVWLILSCELIGIAGLTTGLFVPALLQTGWVVFWVSLLGISLGSTFGLALLFIGLRTRDNETANELSGTSQSIGYSLAAIGPALFGGMHDATGSWVLPLLFLFTVGVCKLISGLLAARNRMV